MSLNYCKPEKLLIAYLNQIQAFQMNFRIKLRMQNFI